MRALNKTVAAIAVLAVCLSAGRPADGATADEIGQAERVVETVRSVVPTRERRLVVNDDVFRDDIVETADRSAARLVFRDETYLSMGPNSRLTIANLPVARTDDQSFVVEAATGVFKFVSGNLRSDQYRIQTPAATIGIRGTIVWLSVDADRVTEVASQVGEVTVCGSGACVTIKRGEYTRTEPGWRPTPPGAIPDSFRDRVRDMVIRLLLAAEGPADLYAATDDGLAGSQPEAVRSTQNGANLQPPPLFPRLPNRSSPVEPRDETPTPTAPATSVTDVPAPAPFWLLLVGMACVLASGRWLPGAGSAPTGCPTVS